MVTGAISVVKTWNSGSGSLHRHPSTMAAIVSVFVGASAAQGRSSCTLLEAGAMMLVPSRNLCYVLY